MTAKSYLKGSQMLALDTSSKLAQGAAAISARQAANRLHREAQCHRRCVTLDDAKKAAKRLWGQGLLTVIVGRAPQAAATAGRRCAQGELDFSSNRGAARCAASGESGPRPQGRRQNRYLASRRFPFVPGDAMLRVARDLTIYENDIEIGFVRASGPGGRTSTSSRPAAQLRFDTRKIALPKMQPRGWCGSPASA